MKGLLSKVRTKQRKNNSVSQDETKHSDASGRESSAKLENESSDFTQTKNSDTNPNEFDVEFINRRENAVERILINKGINSGDIQQHNQWFKDVYNSAGGDLAAVPWADLQPKNALKSWLKANPGDGRTVLEIGCGLGDNAVAFESHGWKVTAFDISESAINWSKQRFPDSKVNFQHADLFNLPSQWLQSFDLVFDCFNLQAFFPGDLRSLAIEAMAGLVRESGELLLISLLKKELDVTSNPPWPLTPENLLEFKKHGLTIISNRTELISQRNGMVPQVSTILKMNSFVGN